MTLTSDAIAAGNPPETRTYWKPILEYPESCDEFLTGMGLGTNDGLRVYHQKSGNLIVLVTCDTHAYQQTDIAYWVKHANGGYEAALMFFPGLVDLGMPIGSVLRSSKWLTGYADVPEDGILTLFYKGRGIGDCGEAIVYDISMPIPRVVSYNRKLDCDGVADDWPSVDTELFEQTQAKNRNWETAKAIEQADKKIADAGWYLHSTAKSDATCNGTEEFWVGATTVHFNKALAGTNATYDELYKSEYNLVMIEGDKVRSWNLGERLSGSMALCAPIAGITIEPVVEPIPGGVEHPKNCPVISVNDSLCDRVRFLWDTSRDRPALLRN